jgi:predicted xylose isomerase-like sugar epimerase
MPGGGDRIRNLWMLFEHARQFEAGGYRGLFSFLNFVRRLRDNGESWPPLRRRGGRRRAHHDHP